MGYILLGTIATYLFAKFMTWLCRKYSDMYALVLIAVVLVCGGCAYTLDRGLHAIPKGYEVSEPVLVEEIEMLPLKEQGKSAYLIASDENFYFYREVTSELANPGEKVYAIKEVAANTVTIIETMEGVPKYQVFEREYKGIPSIWSFALKTYTEQEIVIRIPANGILAMEAVY